VILDLVPRFCERISDGQTPGPIAAEAGQERYRVIMRRVLLTCTAAMIAVVSVAPLPAVAAGGEGEAWPAFTESSSCGAQRIPTAHARETGWLSRDTLLRGEFAAMFGRSVQQVQDDLVRWTIPGSSKDLAVHPRLLPSLDEAAAQINAFLAEGERYRIDGPSTYSTAARTIGGSLRISRHTYGAAFDVNSRRNPFRSDNELVTNLPDWWIQSFLDAGFCWGGLWIGSKDAMHFAWQGPAFSDTKELPLPYQPLTDVMPFTNPAVSIRVVPKATAATLATILVDADNNGAIDVVRVTSRGVDVVIDASLASRRHNACSSRQSVVSGAASLARRAHTIGFGDFDGRGGHDLWIATNEQGLLRITVRWAFGGYSAETSVVTEIPTPSDSAWISTADHDANGAIDMFIVDGDTIEVWGLDPNSGAARPLFSGANPFPGSDEYFLGDFDLDNRPDLWAIRSGVVSTALATDDYRSATTEHRPLALPRGISDARTADYDGDGRMDLITFDEISKQVWLGNTRLSDGLPLEVWFEHEEPDCEEGERTWDRQELRFATSTWISEGSYAWRSRNGLTVGCDPSRDDCQAQPATRQMFSEFLAWIDGLDATTGDTMHAAGTALVRAGYQIPCDIVDAACWSELMPPSEVSSSFGQFLATRRGDVPPPHRWVASGPIRRVVTRQPS